MALSVVVTGASGFIGKSLVKRLKSSKEFKVVPVSRSKVDDFSIIVDDYHNSPSGDILVHLAENSNRSFVNNEGKNYIYDSFNLLDSLISKKYNKIIYCSSSAVYGDKSKMPYTENSLVYAKDNYTKLKLINEKKIINARGIVVRLSNIIGPGMAENNVLSKILSQVSNGGPINLRNLSPVRDFILIDDVLSALELLIIKANSGVFNVSSGVGHSIKDLAETVLKITKDSVLIGPSLEMDEFSYNVLNISKMKKLYGWTPKSSLSQSVNLIIKENE